MASAVPLAWTAFAESRTSVNCAGPGEPLRVSGALREISFLRTDDGGDDVYRVVLSNSDTTTAFQLEGSGDQLRIGTVYEADVAVYGPEAQDRIVFLHANSQCAIDESTIHELGADGVRREIPKRWIDRLRAVHLVLPAALSAWLVCRRRSIEPDLSASD